MAGHTYPKLGFHYFMKPMPQWGKQHFKGYWVRKRGGKLIMHTPKEAVEGIPGQPND